VKAKALSSLLAERTPPDRVEHAHGEGALLSVKASPKG
jgi:hypothetical protein